MANRVSVRDAFSQMHLANALKQEIEAWCKQGWPGVTQTTYELLSYWFNREEDEEERFYACQQRAIETVIYCHEILQAKGLKEIYERVAPEVLTESLLLKEEVESIPFPKYCLKMATGSGKTWVLAALLVWQYFNRLREERPGQYSYRFLVVAPGIEVLNRLLDSFKGKKDPKTGNRNPQTSDYKRSLFMPEGALWRNQFHLEMFEPQDVRANTTPPDGPFVYLTNWQQFRLGEEKASLWDQYTGADVEELPRGEVIADFLSEFPDLVVLNDEAHHVHGKKTKKDEELVWRRFMGVLYEELKERHKEDKGLFFQLDFSATPFFGSGIKKEYFPHIIFDYDLVEAMRDILVKQLFLEERQSIGGEKLEDLDFRAERVNGQIEKLSAGQKLLLEIGRKKLEQLASEFKEKGINKKPVMMVLCEETEVANKVGEHFSGLTDENGSAYDDRQVMVIHSKLKDVELKERRDKLDKIDANDDPLKVVVSVLMLREGFDKTNICVTVVLRATEADLLLEQIVGRGLRLMFSRQEYPEFWDAKVEAYQDICRNKQPSNSLDFLFIVEHPRFRAFYDELRRQGFNILSGDTEKRKSTGDIIPVDVIPSRVPEMDIAWPVQIFETGRMPDVREVDLSKLRKYPEKFSDLKKRLGKLSITDKHVETGTKAKTWKLENEYFDFNYFLGQASRAIAKEGKNPVFTGRQADIAWIVDEYVSNRLFGEWIDFSIPENYQILNYILVYDHVVNEVRQAIMGLANQVHYESSGKWRSLSDVQRISVRENHSVETNKSIYPRLGYSAVGGGFERDFMIEVLNSSTDVMTFAKLDKKHQLKIGYKDNHGVIRSYEPDFIVKNKDHIYIVETKADKELDSPTVALKAQAAMVWCERASTVNLPEDVSQPSEWEYILVSESLFKNNRGLSFKALVPLCEGLANQVLAKHQGQLFPA